MTNRTSRLIGRALGICAWVLLASASGCSLVDELQCGDEEHGTYIFMYGRDVPLGGEVANGTYLDSFYVEFSATYSDLCVERAETENKLTCKLLLTPEQQTKGPLPDDVTLSCKAYAAAGFNPYSASMTRSGDTPGTYVGTVENIGLQQGSSNGKASVLAVARVQFPSRGSDGANVTYAKSFIDTVYLEPDFRLASGTSR